MVEKRLNDNTNLPSRSRYQENWHIKKQLDSGGQANVYIVRPKKASSKQLDFFLKIPKKINQKSRKRLQIEVRSYELLNHNGIPKLVETNADSDSKEIYLITEYINGVDVQSACREKKPTTEQVIRCILKICSILEYIHELGIVHRDIKPKNIMLRDQNWADPVIVDFGLSFLKDEKQTQIQITQLNETIGNRFLDLPELKADSSLKQDPRSDVTLCVGVLFYLLTGKNPVQLSDQNLHLPHQRNDINKILAENHKSLNLQKLNHLFDQAFRPKIDQRFQNIMDLKSMIEELTMHDKKLDITDTQSLQNNILKQLKTTAQQDALEIILTLESVIKIIISSIHNIASEFPCFFHTVQSGYEKDAENFSIKTSLGLGLNTKNQPILKKYAVVFLGNEFIIYCENNVLYRFVKSKGDYGAVIMEKIKEDFLITLNHATQNH